MSVTEKLAVPLVFDHEVVLKKSLKKTKRVVVFLHGYQLDGSFMMKRLSDLFDHETLLIAPNAPFLVPYKKKDRYLPKFSWYFFDGVTKEYYIDFEPAADYVKKIINHYNQEKLPVTLIGYSQGGYLAPRIANFVSEVDSVIALASVFRNKKFEVESHVEYHQINSQEDLIVEYKSALEEARAMKMRTEKYRFHTIKGTGHLIDELYRSELKNVLDSIYS